MCRFLRKVSVLLFILITNGVFAQFPELTIHHLTTRDGLGDGVIRSIGQDKYGYMWIGTVSGLNRFDGKNVKLYQFDPRKPGSPPASVPRSIYSDSQGTLWVGFNNGLYRFENSTDKFIPVSGTQHLNITKIIEDTTSARLFILGSGEVFCLFTSTGILEECRFSSSPVRDITIRKNRLYMLSADEVLLVHLQKTGTEKINKALIPESTMNKIIVDHNDRLWISFSNSSRYLRMVDNSTGYSKTYRLIKQASVDSANNTIRELFIDRMNRVWVMNSSLGMALYNGKTDSFDSYEYVIGRYNSFSSYFSYCIFQSRDGHLWLGTEGYGVDYFNPDKTLFNVISPLENRNIPFNSLWARSAIEDRNGNIWMSWAGGICKYDVKANKYTGFDNFYSGRKMLHNNSVRALYCDEENNIWIGTATGMNRYNAASNTIDFLTWRDSLPENEFYWSIKEDAQHNIWFGTGDGLYYKKYEDKKIYSYRSHPGLVNLIDTGVRTIFVDQKARIWFGMNGTGLIRYDPVRNTYRKWYQSAGKEKALLGNTITAIFQEKSGTIWFSTFYGLMCYDEANDGFKFFTHADKLPSPKCSGILTDDANRLWIGTTAGLAVMDPTRKNFSSFTLEDGLPTLEFTDMPATRLSNGDFIFPTIKGFVRFNPMLHPTLHDTLENYISSIKIFDTLIKGSLNTEDLTHLDLKYNQNFFSLQLVAFNYGNPSRTWYAYKLDGFDSEWIVSPTGVANYTNVPGGSYTFRYKVSIHPDHWDVPEKTLAINIGTVFYKSWWFILLASVSVIALFYLWYRARINQQKRIYHLQSRAQILEKEKALVKFEGLKQQLNPHFLFNSLSSLGSLIRSNQSMAISFLEKLSKTYRYMLQSRDFDLIPLEDEIKFASTYIGLLQTRFNDGLKINLRINAEAYHKKVVPVILQNLIDNAIKHNMFDDESPLIVDIYTEGRYLLIRNNIQRKKIVETSNRQGLNNLISLYRFLTDMPMLVADNDNYFTVRIPLI